jgi:hypothetical protein
MFHVPRAQQELDLGKAPESNHLAIHRDVDSSFASLKLPGATRNIRRWRRQRQLQKDWIEARVKNKNERRRSRRTVGLIQCSGYLVS